MRRMLVLLSILVLVPAAAAAKTLTETIDRTVNVRPGALVELSNVNGNVSVSSWDQPRVRIVAKKEVEAGSGEVAAVMRELRVDIVARDGGVVVTTHEPRDRGESTVFDWFLGNSVETEVTYQVTVPREMNVKLSNSNGAIRLTGVSGRLEVGTTNGAIEVAACGGSLLASTTNGSIEAELQRVTAGQPLRLETTNGRIEIELPKSFAGDLDASTTNGRIVSDLPVAATRSGETALRGRINGGGTPLRMRTTNGGISISVAK